MGVFTAHKITETSFATANQVVTLTRVTNERVVYLGRLFVGQFSLVRVLRTNLCLYTVHRIDVKNVQVKIKKTLKRKNVTKIFKKRDKNKNVCERNKKRYLILV